jgi:hypothetical protein
MQAQNGIKILLQNYTANILRNIMETKNNRIRYVIWDKVLKVQILILSQKVKEISFCLNS